ncbi:DUF6920 family protein [Salinigranum salinum]|uniref:DUF6920 family protein n=1 Tax=Salinigranum salinum TaxID=1364937 RepID=UPI00195B7324|nr:DUF6544 family protein [Salinigranum salinum]
MKIDRGFTRSRALAVAVHVLLTLALLVVGRRREERATAAAVDRLLGSARGRPLPARSPDAFDGLPDPVRRYFETVLPADPLERPAVRVEQRGELRLGPDSSWTGFAATHHATTRRPGFVWDATVDLAPAVSVRVRDGYVDGGGSARVALFGALPVDGATPSPELNEAALQRYLAEAVWYPQALLPEHGVSWEPIDDRTARATLAHGGTTASLTFHFSPENEVERVHATARNRRVGDGYEPTPWTGLWRDYEVRDGAPIPTAGEVVWHLPDNDFHAWRGRVTEIESLS